GVGEGAAAVAASGSAATPVATVTQASVVAPGDVAASRPERLAPAAGAPSRSRASGSDFAGGSVSHLPPTHLLLATKFHVPRIAARLVERPHVYQRLQRGIERPLTLVTAPAGFGKTVALGDWV